MTRDPEVRHSQSANPVAVARYGLAVRKQYAKQGESDVDFFNMVAFGNDGELLDYVNGKGNRAEFIRYCIRKEMMEERKNIGSEKTWTLE